MPCASRGSSCKRKPLTAGLCNSIPTMPRPTATWALPCSNRRTWTKRPPAYRRALELKPHLADAHNNLGLALQDQGKLDEAAACCRGALQLAPDLAAAHNNLGNVLTHRGDLHAGTGLLTAGLWSSSPNFPRPTATCSAPCNMPGHHAGRSGPGPCRVRPGHAAPWACVPPHADRPRDRRAGCAWALFRPTGGRHPVAISWSAPWRT